MKTCEYANNLFDMVYLCDITEENKKIAFGRRVDSLVHLMQIYKNIHTTNMAFPIIDKEHNKYLQLKDSLLVDTFYYYFSEALYIYPKMYIQFDD